MGHAGGRVAVRVRQPQVRRTRVEAHIALLRVRTERDDAIICGHGTRQSTWLRRASSLQGPRPLASRTGPKTRRLPQSCTLPQSLLLQQSGSPAVRHSHKTFRWLRCTFLSSVLFLLHNATSNAAPWLVATQLQATSKAAAATAAALIAMQAVAFPVTGAPSNKLPAVCQGRVGGRISRHAGGDLSWLSYFHSKNPCVLLNFVESSETHP